MQNLRFAFRQLARSPLHTFTVVFILALGIGANTAIFSLVRSVLLKPLPYPAPERVMFLQQRMRDSIDSPFSWPNLQDVALDNHSFSAVGCFARDSFSVTGRGSAEQLQAAMVNPAYFEVLGVAPLLGRTFTPAEDGPGGAAVVVLKESFWRRKLGGDPGVLGQSLTINAKPYTIIGVLPTTAMTPGGTEFWLPVAPFADNDSWRNRRNQPGLFALARLKAGVTLDQARADLQTIGERLQRDYPADNAAILPTVRPLMDVVTAAYRTPIAMLMTAVGLLLVIACANVASLQLLRGLSRGPEFSIRAALGAGRFPLARLLLTESLVLAVLGGALGCLLAFWSVDAIRALSPATPRFQAIAVDRAVLAFSALLALGTGVLSGLWPAWRASRVDLRESLHAGGQKGAGAASWPRQAMVALQVALTFVLLAGAGLFGRSLLGIARFPYGFDPTNLLLVQASLPDAPGRYDTEEKRIAFFERVKTRIGTLPGVKSVGLNYSAPLRMDWSQLFHLEGRPQFPTGQEPFMEMNVIDSDYFKTLGLPLLQGRNFDATDVLNGTRAIIIDQRMAETFWPGENPIGKIVLRGNVHNPIERRRTVVVGVVPTVEADGFEPGPKQYQAYLAQSQSGQEAMYFVIRTNVVPRSLVESVRAALAAEDPSIPAYGIATMDELVAQQSGQQRLYSLLVGLFAAVALLLCALGLYGVVAQAVTARRREIGIRLALGALAQQVVALVLRQGAWPMTVGLVAGLAGALAGGRFVSSLLFKVSPFDPLVLLAAAAVLVVVAFLALWMPARRAGKVDPMVALRTE